MTTYFVDDARDDEAGFTALRPIPEARYKLGDGLGGSCHVRASECLFEVAAELGDGYADNDNDEDDWLEVLRAYGLDDRPSDFSALYRRPVDSRFMWINVITVALATWGFIALGLAALTLLD